MKKIVVAVLLLAANFAARADEGMWMVNLVDKALERNMKKAGSKLSSKVIYDESKGGLTDAVVSLSFGCTGSMISADGLMITNHHCAYSDIFNLSTPEHNYLEDGFWAMRRNEEIPIREHPGVYFLNKVIDITEETVQVRDKEGLNGKPMGSRKLSYMMEKKYAKDYPGQEVSMYSMFAGEKYYLMVYTVYKDVRLVAAPPVCLGSFGGDIDNWEWPQHKGDFAIYRIYTAPDGSPAEYSDKNVPMHPKKTLKINTAGVREGDFTMTIGYPGMTNRYASSFEVDALAKAEYPIIGKLMKERMDIITAHMNADPAVRLKYSDRFFMLSNVQEIRESAAECMTRTGVAEKFAQGREKKLSKGLLDSLKACYEGQTPISCQVRYYQEAGVRSGNMFRLASLINTKASVEKKRKWLDSVDLPLEKEIFLLNIKELGENIKPEYWGAELTKWYGLYAPEKAGEAIWNASAIASGDPDAICAMTKEDPLVKAVHSIRMNVFNDAKKNAEGDVSLQELRRRYKVAVYRNGLAEGAVQYPDANSTMRLSYGNVCNLVPCDAVLRMAHSTSKGIIEKYNPADYNFTLKDPLPELYRKGDWGRWAAPDGTMWVNFLTTNDITGGNSGSPVVDAKGRLVGLAFDGNKEGLACDVYYDPALNRTVCVDIRYVLWVLDKYAHMDCLLDEILK